MIHLLRSLPSYKTVTDLWNSQARRLIGRLWQPTRLRVSCSHHVVFFYSIIRRENKELIRESMIARGRLKHLTRCFGQSTAPATQSFPEFPEFTTFEQLHRWSLANHEEFWARVSRSMIAWDKPFNTIANNDLAKGRVEWFRQRGLIHS